MPKVRAQIAGLLCCIEKLWASRSATTWDSFLFSIYLSNLLCKPIDLAPVALQVCHTFPTYTVTIMARDGANVEFNVNMDSIAIYLKDKGIPDEVCDKLEDKSMYKIASVQKY